MLGPTRGIEKRVLVRDERGSKNRREIRAHTYTYVWEERGERKREIEVEEQRKIYLRVALRRRTSCPASRALSASPWPAVRVPDRSFLPRAHRPLRLAASQLHQLRVPATLLLLSLSLSLSLSPSLGNMTDGHGRTTIGHRVRGQGCHRRAARALRRSLWRP